jgi:CysZ protein
MFAYFFKSIAQFYDPRFRLMVWRELGLTFAVLITACTLIVMGLNQLAQAAAVTAIISKTYWLGNLLNIGGVLLTFVLSIWLMVPIASAIISSFFDEVARAVEARHYPNLPATRGMKLQDQILATLGFFGILLLANLGALILSIFMPFLAPFIFWATNGYLLGREYFQVAAMRSMSRSDATRLFQRHRGAIWFSGI